MCLGLLVGKFFLPNLDSLEGAFWLILFRPIVVMALVETIPMYDPMKKERPTNSIARGALFSVIDDLLAILIGSAFAAIYYWLFPNIGFGLFLFLGFVFVVFLPAAIASGMMANNLHGENRE